jgi:hypothetical protein
LAQYDANILQKFADNLYAKARSIIFQCGLVGAVIGALLAIPIAIYVSGHNHNDSTQAIIDRYKGTGNGFNVPLQDSPPPANDPTGLIAAGVFATIGCLIGVSSGQKKAFQYKLQAQLTLCQMQTEFNTRTQIQTTAA